MFTKIKKTADFLLETMQERKEWRKHLSSTERQKKKSHQSSILYLVKMSFKNEGNTKKIHHQCNYSIGNVKPEEKIIPHGNMYLCQEMKSYESDKYMSNLEF